MDSETDNKGFSRKFSYCPGVDKRELIPQNGKKGAHDAKVKRIYFASNTYDTPKRKYLILNAFGVLAGLELR